MLNQYSDFATYSRLWWNSAIVNLFSDKNKEIFNDPGFNFYAKQWDNSPLAFFRKSSYYYKKLIARRFPDWELKNRFNGMRLLLHKLQISRTFDTTLQIPKVVTYDKNHGWLFTMLHASWQSTT